jgi:hypothetical protein
LKGLHGAVASGDEAAVRLLLREQDVNARDEKGCTPLLLAECIKDEASYDSIVQILIENGADVNICHDTPLHSAVFYQKQHLVAALLRAGADVRRNNLLHIAAEKGCEGILGLLLADKRCTEDMINSRDASGRTPAFLAALHDHKACLKMLIARGADLSLADANEDTVMGAVFENMTRAVEFTREVLDSSVGLEKVNEKNRYYVGKSGAGQAIMEFSVSTSRFQSTGSGEGRETNGCNFQPACSCQRRGEDRSFTTPSYW